MTLGQAAYAVRVAVETGRTIGPPPDRPEWRFFLGLPRREPEGPPNLL
jgi:hypothetical protein